MTTLQSPLDSSLARIDAFDLEIDNRPIGAYAGDWRSQIYPNFYVLLREAHRDGSPPSQVGESVHPTVPDKGQRDLQASARESTSKNSPQIVDAV
ncbi:hypothetical protein CIB48_g1005 [Xylaria polymorpha]|nr:hypothetical protein CIB48_g1005 [Xylaria polymorpha]